MSNKIGLSATTKSVVQTRPPRLLIISGATGVGKIYNLYSDCC